MKKPLIDIPSLLPFSPENENNLDLFDVTFPEIEIHSQDHWRDILLEFSQLHEGDSAPEDSSTGSSYPLTFTDITLRELAAEYQRAYPDDKIRVDGTTDSLVFGRPKN